MYDDDELLRAALAEDIGPGDLTTSGTVPADSRCRAVLRAKAEGVLSGIMLFRRVFELLDADLSGWKAMRDGSRFKDGSEIASFSARTAPVLTGERTALNILQRLCGTATLTKAFADAISGTRARICDTRKTTPLWRKHEKAAVRHGGGANHRSALFDGILIKENHIAAAGSIAAAIHGARNVAHHLLQAEIEVETLAQLEEAIDSGARAVLLDNMPLDDMRAAAARCRGTGILLEASGNMTLDRVRSVAECGVDLISVGALTHSAPAADLSLRIEILD